MNKLKAVNTAIQRKELYSDKTVLTVRRTLGSFSGDNKIYAMGIVVGWWNKYRQGIWVLQARLEDFVTVSPKAA